MARSRRSLSLILWVVYIVLMVAIVAAIDRGRAWSEDVLTSEQAQSQWQQFRDDVITQSEQGSPVRRRVPRSVEPPALVLMRDHYMTCVVISLVLSSALYAAFSFFVMGVATSDRADDSESDERLLRCPD